MVSETINLFTSEFLHSMTFPNLKQYILSQILRDEFREITMNIMAAQDHVPKIEHRIRVIKERVEAIMSTLQFQHLPVHVLFKLINFAA